jgi:hypothetical protein
MTNDEMMFLNSYKYWVSLMSATGIPEESWTDGYKTIRDIVEGDKTVVDFLYTKPKEWIGLGYLILIDGLKTTEASSADEVKRRLGFNLVTAAMGYLALTGEGSGLYMDFNRTVAEMTTFNGQVFHSTTMKRMFNVEILFVNDISTRMGINKNAALKVQNEMSTIVRTRVEQKKTTILSFRDFCRNVVDEGGMGMELDRQLTQHGPTVTIHNVEKRVIRLATSVPAISIGKKG